MKKIKYKNHLGYDSYSLFHPDLGEIKEYRKYIEPISLEGKINTTKDTAQDLKRFFEYIYAFTHLKEFKDQCVHATALSSLILGYPKYLTEGVGAVGLPGEIAKLTKSKPIKNTSANRLLSSVRAFLEYSSAFHADLKSFKDQDLINIDIDPSTLFEELDVRRKLTFNERQAMLSKSMLSGVISGGAKYTKSRIFRTLDKEEDSLVDKAFPFHSVIDVIDQATTYRDTCYWALLAGTGPRHSEASQILLTDIDVKERKVFLVDPELRPSVYASIPNDWRNELTWKSRSTKATFFLEPFKSIFFNNLVKLLQERKKMGVNHKFLFITMDNAHDSRPYYMASNTSVNDAFKNAQMKLWSDNKDLTLSDCHTVHSLRHFYGVWLLNYLKIGPNRYGLSVSSVQKLMGHKLESSTKKYAVKDKFLLEATINLANTLIEKTKADLSEIVNEALEYKMTRAKETFLGIE